MFQQVGSRSIPKLTDARDERTPAVARPRFAESDPVSEAPQPTRMFDQQPGYGREQCVEVGHVRAPEFCLGLAAG